MTKPRFTPSLQWSDPKTGMLTGEAQRILRAILDLSWNRTGLDTSKVVTGTAGTNGNISKWDANGDLVDGGKVAANLLSTTDIGVSVQGYSADLTDLIAKWVAASAAAPASLDFAEDTDNGTNRVRVTVPASLTGDRTFTLPDVDISFTSFIATLLDDVSAAAALTTLGIVVGSTTPSVTAASGAFTTVSCSLRYALIPGIAGLWHAIVTITTNGTAAGDVRVPLPFTPVAQAAFAGYNNSTGAGLLGRTAGATAFFNRYDAAYPGGDGVVLMAGGVAVLA